MAETRIPVYDAVMQEDIVSLRPSETGVFFVKSVGLSHCDGSYVIRRREYRYWAAVHILGGHGLFRIRGTDHRPAAGDTCILERGRDHTYQSSAEDPWVQIWVEFGGPLAEALFTQLGLKGVHHVPNSGVGDLLLNILRAAKAHIRGDRFQKDAALMVHELLYRIYDRIHVADDADIDPVDSAASYLRRSIRRSVSLEEIATQAGKSPSQLVRLFRRRMGKTPHEYFVELKMERARILLRESSLSMKQIAWNLGFCDRFHFSKVFKRTVGIPPGEYRRS
jgi:AraC-like DNA-binding protein